MKKIKNKKEINAEYTNSEQTIVCAYIYLEELYSKIRPAIQYGILQFFRSIQD